MVWAVIMTAVGGLVNSVVDNGGDGETSLFVIPIRWKMKT